MSGNNTRVIILAILCVVFGMIFYRRVSGFVLTSNSFGTDITISMMDLKEYSAWTSDQKSMYNMLLTSNVSALQDAVNKRDFNKYKSTLDSIVQAAFMAQPQTQRCAPGTFSTTGNAPCTPCPAGTFCPTPGMTQPMQCAMGTTSQSGATACTPRR